MRKEEAKMSNIDTVLFDFDGTVMDTNNVILNSWQHTFRTLAGREEKQEVLVKTFGEPLEDTMKKFFPDVPIEKSLYTYRSYHRDNFCELIRMCPGMKELLAQVKAAGYKTGLVTSRLKLTTDQGLEKYGITDLFDTIITADDTSAHKPDPEPINIALRRLGSKAENAVMVGDTMYDILCAKNAGVKSVFVSWSIALEGDEDFGGNYPDYTIDKAEELMGIIK